MGAGIRTRKAPIGEAGGRFEVLVDGKVVYPVVAESRIRRLDPGSGEALPHPRGAPVPVVVTDPR